MSPADPKDMVARRKQAATPAEDAARCGMNLNDRSYRTVGSAMGSFPQLVAPSLASPKVQHRV